jgi:hypothetical protein
MKKIFNHMVLSMKTFNHVIISTVIKIQLGTKTWLYNYMTRKWSLVIFVIVKLNILI